MSSETGSTDGGMWTTVPPRDREQKVRGQAAQGASEDAEAAPGRCEAAVTPDYLDSRRPLRGGCASYPGRHHIARACAIRIFFFIAFFLRWGGGETWIWISIENQMSRALVVE